MNIRQCYKQERGCLVYFFRLLAVIGQLYKLH